MSQYLLHSLAVRLTAALALSCTATAVAQQTAAPVLTPGAGTYPAGQTVTISDATPGAVIYYGVHGVVPTTHGTLYTGPIPVSGTETVIAMAIAPGFTQSALISVTYKTANPPAAAPAFSPAAGSYAAPQMVTLSSTTPGAVIHYGVHGALPSATSPVYTSPILVSGTETVLAIAIAPGYSNSAVSTSKYVTPNIFPAAAPTFSPAAGNYLYGQKITISDATAGATIYYTTDGSTPTTASKKYTAPVPLTAAETLQAIAVAPMYSLSSVGSAAYQLLTATPVLSPATFTSPTTRHVTISDSTSGATIYYTTDGSAPTTGSTPYTGLITIANTTNLNAIAVAPGYLPSNSAHGAYVITLINTIAGQLSTGFSGDGGPATNAEMQGLTAIAFDTSQNLYIGDFINGRIRKVDSNTGIITTVATIAQVTYTTPGGGGPHLAIDHSGNFYFSDPTNNVIRKVDATTGSVSVFAGTVGGDAGYSGDGGPATSARLQSPAGIAFDASGNLYIADTANNVIRKVDAGSGVITTVAGNNAAGCGAVDCDPHPADGGPATAAILRDPSDVAFDSQGNLFIADTADGAIRKVDATSWTITTYAGFPATPPAKLGDGGLATNAELDFPNAVVIDSAGNLFISDSGNSRVRMVSPSTGIITTVVGGGYSVDDGVPATTSYLYGVGALVVDSAGNLFVDDGSRVRKVSLSAASAPTFGLTD